MPDAPRSSRRRFFRQAGAWAGVLALPALVPSGVLAQSGTPGANDRVTIGYIGAGGRARLLMQQMPASTQVVAVADAMLPRAAEANQLHGEGKWAVYHDYRRVLDEKGIDAVMVPTTDHARVSICIHACLAGKDIYAEKPLTVCIGEGRALVQAVRKCGRVFQVGSQQRTMEMNRFACEFVRTGGLGKVHTVLARNYPGPNRYAGLPEQPVPEGLDWDAWCAQTELRPYNGALQYGWMGWRDYSGGEVTNWGAHGFDQVQWALGMDESGPVEMWPETEGLNGKVHMRYANGVLLRAELEDSGPMGGAIFIGEKGKIEINRNKYTTNPADLIPQGPPQEAADVWEGPGWQAKLHIENWLECIKTRKRPNADVEIGHRSVSVCHLVNITRELGRRLRWDPKTETFPGDAEANAYLLRPRRKGYELPNVT